MLEVAPTSARRVGGRRRTMSERKRKSADDGAKRRAVEVVEPDCSGIPDNPAGYACRTNVVCLPDGSSPTTYRLSPMSPLAPPIDPWVEAGLTDDGAMVVGRVESPLLPAGGGKKKGVGVAGRSIEEEVCLICGDRASGYHYNALSCEGCKGFFRRSITRSAVYACKYGGHCEMDMWMRRRCQACRLLRCREAGMKEECLLSDDQCRARDARRKARQKVQQSTTAAMALTPDFSQPDTQTGDGGGGGGSGRVKVERGEAGEDGDSRGGGGVEVEVNPLERLTDEHRDLVETLVMLQDEYELPKDADLERISHVRISDHGRPKDMPESIYKHMAEMTVLVTQLVVEFAKRLPRFTLIPQSDQIVLLKGASGEVMMLRAARRYDITTDTVVFANGLPFSRDNLRTAGLHEYADGMFNFCHGMGRIGVDNAEFALLTAICIFSERPGVQLTRQVEQIQEWYVSCLRAYESFRRPRSSNFLAKMLMKLTELRTLSIEHSDMLFSLKVEKGSLPPLLEEYFYVTDD